MTSSMADDHSNSGRNNKNNNNNNHSHDLLSILGFGRIGKACKSLVSKCYPHKKSSLPNLKSPHHHPTSNINPHFHDQDTVINNSQGGSSRGLFKNKSFNNAQIKSSLPSIRRSHSSSPFSRIDSSSSRNGQAARLSSMSGRNSLDRGSTSLPRSLSRGATLIMYSNSSGFIKPPALEMQLECTLEELCFGCIKTVKITTDVLTENGQITEEDKVLSVKVKPGWTKGTRITFKEMGSETPGTQPADVIFIVSEKPHPKFKREGDDLELTLEISLLEALTGSVASIPLLGRPAMSLEIDDVIHPGYEKIVKGEGMPKQNDPERRGNLIIKFLVQFPKELTEEQRCDVANILCDT